MDKSRTRYSRPQKSRRADLGVIGRRGLSALERLLMGGTSSAVVAHSKCDVLVVK
ncbi:MAG: universal stress protein [Thaumarchaeota archaeon]|nr:universal stress protein [Nitrososphaerota archaeon]